MKLKKHNCVVLVKYPNDKLSKTIIGVFKNKKQANKYLTWLEKDKSNYVIMPKTYYEYENEVKGE